jgi:hypothetical protein
MYHNFNLTDPQENTAWNGTLLIEGDKLHYHSGNCAHPTSEVELSEDEATTLAAEDDQNWAARLAIHYVSGECTRERFRKSLGL